MLGGCAGGRSYGERTILDSLRDAGVERPGPDGQWVRESSERDSGLAASSAAAPGGAAALPETGEVTLAELLRVAELHNPRQAATRSEAGIAAGRAWQAWLYPNPSVEVEAEEITFGDGADGSEVKVGVSQPLVLGGRREAAVNAAEAEREARLWDAAAVRRELFGDVSGEFAQLASLRKQARLYGELRGVIEGTLEVARTRVEARAAPEMELIRVRVELQRLEVAARRVDRQIEAAERRLSALLGGAAVEAERLAEPADSALAPLDFAALESRVRATHPSLAALEQEIAAAESRLAEARAERTPDLELRAGVGYSDEADDGIVELGAGMALPLWDRKQGAILAERFGVLRARQQLAAKGDALAAELADAVGAYETAREEAAATREAIVPDAQRAFELTRTAYEAGRASFLDVFDAQRTLVEARVALVEAEGRAAAALAQVGGIAGPREAGYTDEAEERP
jgi:cobalt-zinc-cadmium efflux system outer membrane protein